MRKSYLILTVVVVPNIKPAVLSGKEKDSHSGWREAAITQVAGVVSGFNEWCS